VTGLVPCFIPARGGSVRIPRKNLKPFCGRPLIAWTIEAALGAKNITPGAVYLSTDDDEIAEAAKSFGAQVIRRDWTSPSEEMGNIPIQHAMRWVEREVGPFEFMCTLLSTGPCRRPTQIDEAMDLLYKRTFWEVMYAYNPKECSVLIKLNDGGAVSILFDKDQRHYTWTGGDGMFQTVYYDRYTSEILKHERFWDQLYGIIPLELWQCQDTDTEEQWEVAEYWFKRKVLDVYGPNPYARKE
jgi:pseudaminic acid cytidylyltransferase